MKEIKTFEERKKELIKKGKERFVAECPRCGCEFSYDIEELTISIGGDTDTLLAISCAIAEAYYKEIDEELINKTLSLFPKPSKGCNPLEIIYKYLEDRTITKSMEEEISEDTLLLCTKRTTSKFERIFWSYSKYPSSLIDYQVYPL